MGQGGVTVTDGSQFVSVRARGIGDRPGNGDGTLTAQGYLIFDVMAGTKIAKQLDLNLTINNALSSAWREAQFAATSAVSPTAMPIEQMHFTPGIPLTATITAAYTF
jgi:outer membrane receptor for monomeric catechols